MACMSGSAASLRSLAAAFMAAVSQLDNNGQSAGGGGEGMMPGLQRLSGRQAAINAATSDLLSSLLRQSGSAPGEEGESVGQGTEAARRAAQGAEQAIADQLEQLSEKYGNQAGQGGLNDRVQELKKEAEALAQMLRHPCRPYNDRTAFCPHARRRLSMHRQGEGRDEYQSKSADAPFTAGAMVRPGVLFQDKDAFHRLRERAFQGNYPEAYREALLKYSRHKRAHL